MTAIPRAATADELRIIVVFRADLPEMTAPKAEIQFGHAVCGTIAEALKGDPTVFDRYMAGNQPKVNMEVDGLDDLRRIMDKCRARGVPCELIEDAAHTVFSEPTYTCIGIGPTSKTNGNAVTRGARMRVDLAEERMQLAVEAVVKDMAARG